MSKFQECADCSSAFCAVHRECTNGKAKAIMTDTFDPTPQRKPDDMLALAAGVLDAATKGGVRFKKHAIEAAAAYLRTRIEAAFVPKEWRDCQVNAGRQLLAEATARAEAAEARVKALLESIGILEAALKAIAGSHWERWGMDQTDINEVPDHSGEEAMEIARAALGEDHDK